MFRSAYGLPLSKTNACLPPHYGLRHDGSLQSRLFAVEMAAAAGPGRVPARGPASHPPFAQPEREAREARRSVWARAE